jgi:hypothetical protein
VLGVAEQGTEVARFGRRERVEFALRVPDRVGEGADPGGALVADVPDRGEDAAVLEDAAQFGQGFGAVEPVEGLAGGDGVGGGVRQRERLGRSGERAGDAGAGVDELGAHPVVGFDGLDAVPEDDQAPGEQAGSRTEVDDVARPVAEHPAEGFGGVGGADGVVEVGGGAEGAGGVRVDGHIQTVHALC